MNKHEAGGSFVITAPSTVTLPASLTTCNVIYNSVPYNILPACTISSRIITLGAGFTQPVAKGDEIKIELGPITNPVT